MPRENLAKQLDRQSSLAAGVALGAEIPELNRNEVGVWLVDLDAGLSPDNVDSAEPGPEFDVLSDDERERAARFVRARDRRRFARCRAAAAPDSGGAAS